MEIAGPSATAAGAASDVGRERLLWMGGALVVVLLALWPTLKSFGAVWERYDYSHGYITALVALWLLWRRRDALLEGRPYWVAAFPLVGLSLVWVLATVTSVQVVHEGVLPLLVLAWIATLAGPRAARRLLPGVAVFLFAVPFWEVLVPPLQALTIKVSGTAVSAMGVQAVIRGDRITIPAGTFHVEGACAGIAFFIVGLLISTLYAHLFLDRWRTRIEVLALGAVIAIIGNWVRVTGLIMIGHFTHMQSSLMQEHGLYGWVIFTVAFLLLFFPGARYLDGKEKAGRGEGPQIGGMVGGESAGSTGGESTLEQLSPAGGSAGSRKAGAASVPQLLLVTGLAVVGPLLYYGLGAIPTSPANVASLPTPGGSWREVPGSQARPIDWSPAYRQPDSTRTERWTDGSADVYVDWIMYRRERQGRELVGGDNRIAPSSRLVAQRTLWLRDTDRWVRQAAVALPDQRKVLLVWYWYRVGGIEAVSPAWAKLLQVVAFVRRRPASEVVALSTVCTEDDCTDAVQTLRTFLGGGTAD